MEALQIKKETLRKQIEQLESQFSSVKDEINALKTPFYLQNWIAKLHFAFDAENEERFRKWFFENITLPDITIITWNYVGKYGAVHNCTTCGYFEGRFWHESLRCQSKWEGEQSMVNNFAKSDQRLKFQNDFAENQFDNKVDNKVMKEFVIGFVLFSVIEENCDFDDEFLVTKGEDYEI